MNDLLLGYKPATAFIWLQREQRNLNHVSGRMNLIAEGQRFLAITHNLLSWTLILPFRVSCSALMMSIKEFSRECMLKPSNERGRSCEGRKGGWVSRKNNYDGISHIPRLCGSIPFIYNRVQAVVLLFLSKTISCWKEVTNEKLNRGSRPKYKSNLVLATDLTSRSCG